MSVTPIKPAPRMQTIADVQRSILIENARILGESACMLAIQSAELLAQAQRQESAQVILESAKWIHGEFFKINEGKQK
jgi:hypothetical protein